MSHPRVEEVSESDSDPSIEDPSEYAPSLIRPSQIPPPSSSPRQQQPPEYLQPQFQSPNNPPATTQDTEAHKHYQCIYPLYFDASRTRAQGRRVGKEQAVENPLARTIVDAVAALGLQTVFEPGKMHPRDWGNPGRVRVLLKEGGRMTNRNIKNTYLLSHPTTANSPLRLRIHGMPPPDPNKPIPPPAVPRGWHINSILPLHSPALSGGGVSENILKDMMAQMGGQGGGMPGMDALGGMGGMEGMQKMMEGMGMGGVGGPSVGGGGGGGREIKKKGKDKKK
ncbi:MAG: hypothetical protein L6R42_005062 [Xanthoria sp. 1 TBL-2021]|nr:MAG: hypothetical protein L6R42_005062 [Xanthoria sp. 1 TBL-2021]